MTKTEAVRRHLKINGSITSWQAIQMYGETRLSAVIHNLREKGWDIESVWKEGKDRNGNDSRWVEYCYTPEVEE